MLRIKEKELIMLGNDIENLGYSDLTTFFIDAHTGIKLVEKLRMEYKNSIIIRNQNPQDICNNKLVLSLQYLMEGINVA